jgi:formate dehydrogenase iron-sulfur subunit
MKHFAILTDVTKCIGCEDCVAACKKTNDTGADAPYTWQLGPSELSSTRWTSLAAAPEGRWARTQCRHCIDPGCAAACPVGALHLSDEGPVIYDADICMGCRYCMVACPFGFTRYEWDSWKPRVRKCILCHDKITSGELEQPACTTACPTGATIFGDREELLAEAKRRIADRPDLYIDHVWGETEVGGTSVLYISDVDLDEAGWPDRLTDTPRPILARKVLHTVPYTFVGVSAVMAGVNWTFERRKKVAAAEGAERALDSAQAEGGDDQ